MHTGIIRVLFQQQNGLFAGLLKVSARDQQICQLHAGVVVIRLQFDGASQFLSGALPILQFEVGLSQLMVGFRITRIDLHGIGIFN